MIIDYGQKRKNRRLGRKHLVVLGILTALVCQSRVEHLVVRIKAYFHTMVLWRKGLHGTIAGEHVAFSDDPSICQALRVRSDYEQGSSMFCRMFYKYIPKPSLADERHRYDGATVYLGPVVDNSGIAGVLFLNCDESLFSQPGQRVLIMGGYWYKKPGEIYHKSGGQYFTVLSTPNDRVTTFTGHRSDDSSVVVPLDVNGQRHVIVVKVIKDDLELWIDGKYVRQPDGQYLHTDSDVRQFGN
jgi:hypothetical protein